MGENIYYCCGRREKLPSYLPATIKVIHSFRELSNLPPSIIIFSEKFIQNKNWLNKIDSATNCLFLSFSEPQEKLSLLKKFNFFDYFTPQTPKDVFHFKITRATNYLNALLEFKRLKHHFFNEKEKTSNIDRLTGCFNWRYFSKKLKKIMISFDKSSHKISFLCIDIDNFHQINEIYSQTIADNVIRKLALILKNNIRSEDILCRWRSDEFFLLLPDINKSDAYKIARRIKRSVAAGNFSFKNYIIDIKVSIGIVTAPDDNVYNTRDIINALSKCLVRAKKQRGDRIIIYSQSDEEIPKIDDLETASINELREKIRELRSLLNRDIFDTIYAFARAIEMKDSYTGKHVELTAQIAEALAKELHLPPQEVEDIKRAGVLHDLGKVGIAEDILHKNGPLTVAERDIIKNHPWIAAEILREIRSLRGTIPAILYHHERYDGRGYPLGLKGDEIPLGAKIVAIADVYQALISDRPYRKAFSKRKALEIIRQASGKQFDPIIVKTFLKIIKKIH